MGSKISKTNVATFKQNEYIQNSKNLSQEDYATLKKIVIANRDLRLILGQNVKLQKRESIIDNNV